MQLRPLVPEVRPTRLREVLENHRIPIPKMRGQLPVRLPGTLEHQDRLHGPHVRADGQLPGGLQRDFDSPHRRSLWVHSVRNSHRIRVRLREIQAEEGVARFGRDRLRAGRHPGTKRLFEADRDYSPLRAHVLGYVERHSATNAGIVQRWG